MFILYSTIIVLFAGTMSGLTVGYSSIDPLQLEILLLNGTEEEKLKAHKILPIIERKHLLLATLLLSNALAMESLPIFLDAIMPATLAIILSTTVVLIFGEVIPQAICMGEDKVPVAAALAPFISTLICVLYPICYPISKALDYFLGHGETRVRFKKKDLKAIMELHQTKKNPNFEGLTNEEVKIINSIIDIRNVTVCDIMIPFEKSFNLDTNDVISQQLIERIKQKNFSRIPIVSDKKNVIGFIKTKTLLQVHLNLERKVNSIKIQQRPIYIARNTNLLEAIKIMKENDSSVLVVTQEEQQLRKSVMLRSRNDMIVKEQTATTQGILGFVFLKDIFEELIKAEIHDQDLHYDSKAQFYGKPNTQVKVPFPQQEPQEQVEMKEYEKEPLLIKDHNN